MVEKIQYHQDDLKIRVENVNEPFKIKIIIYTVAAKIERPPLHDHTLISAILLKIMIIIITNFCEQIEPHSMCVCTKFQVEM